MKPVINSCKKKMIRLGETSCCHSKNCKKTAHTHTIVVFSAGRTINLRQFVLARDFNKSETMRSKLTKPFFDTTQKINISVHNLFRKNVIKAGGRGESARGGWAVSLDQKNKKTSTALMEFF